MTLEQVFLTCDDDQVLVIRSGGEVKKCGKWFEDHMLGFLVTCRDFECTCKSADNHRVVIDIPYTNPKAVYHGESFGVLETDTMWDSAVAVAETLMLFEEA